MASPKSLYIFLVLYAICLMTLACFVDYELSFFPNRGTDCCSHTQDSDSLLITQTLGLPSYSNHLLLALYSCYLIKFLYNMILLPSDAHLNVIKNQHCRALLVLCHALIVLLLMISGNVHVHSGPSTVAIFIKGVNNSRPHCICVLGLSVVIVKFEELHHNIDDFMFFHHGLSTRNSSTTWTKR
jgi:hypothetical protein